MRVLLLLILRLVQVASQPAVPHQVSELRLVRQFLPSVLAADLYQDLLDAALVYPTDSFDPRVLGIKGDAGTPLDATLGRVERAETFHALLQGDRPSESGILRVEHLAARPRNRTQRVIQEVVENHVLEDDGTIHLYLSSPNAAALGNHTDVTSIFVLQLAGAKEWMLCQDKKKDKKNGKLDQCATYKDPEMDDLDCQRETLYPGDALHLPKRVVHSARATPDGLSAHLTFGFADTQCWEEPAPLEFLESHRNRNLCSSSCDSSCDGSCDSGCDCSCYYGSCNGCCDFGCDSLCNSSCDSGCGSSSSGSSSSGSSSSGSSSSSSSTSSSSSGLSGGAIAAIVIAVLVAVGGTITCVILCVFLSKKRQGTSGSTKAAMPAAVGMPAVAMPVTTAYNTTTFVARKDSPTTKVGLHLKEQAHPSRVILIQGVEPDGIFAPTGLQAGMHVLSFNGVDCQAMPLSTVVAMIQNSQGEITLVVGTPQTTPTMEAPPLVELAVHKDMELEC